MGPGTAKGISTTGGMPEEKCSKIHQTEGNRMAVFQQSGNQTGMGIIAMALVCLVGIIVLSAGYFSGNRIALYAGLLITLAGVLTGIVQIVAGKRMK